MVMRVLGLILVLVAAGRAQQAPPPEVRQARQLLGQKKYGEAEKVLAAFVATQPQHLGAWYFLGYARHAAGKLDEALAAYRKSFAHPAIKPTALYNAACVCARSEKPDQALAYLEQAVAAGFKNWGLLRTDAELAQVRGRDRFAALIPTFLEGADAFVEKVRILHCLDGESANDQFGWVARPMGDLDGDGAIDFATSAPTKTAGGPAAGRVYAYSSRTGKLLFQRDGTPKARLGSSLAGAGDVDKDGTPDVLAGAPGAGAAYVFSGRDGKTILTLTSKEAGDGFGIKLCGLGDLDGDGCADVLVGAWRSGAAGKDAGRAYAFSGKTGKSLFVLDGPQAGARYGSAVDAVSANGKGLLVVGAMNDGPGQRGRAYVYKLDGAKATPFFRIEPDATSRHLGQYFVSILGDVDGDVTPDVYASDFGNTAKGPSTGRVFIHSGKTGARLHTLTGSAAGEGFGTSPSWAGDVDGDGCADLAIGAWQHGSAAKSGGRCYVYSGKTGAILATYTSRQANDTLGFDACGLGDVDGDGAIDFLFTSAWSEIQGPQTGRIWIVAGTVK